jgi:hypothetical protein
MSSINIETIAKVVRNFPELATKTISEYTLGDWQLLLVIHSPETLSVIF